MISGSTPPTDGEMTFRGQPYAPRDVVDARRSGVDIVFQEPGLIDTMTVEENLLLGREAAYAPHVGASARKAPASRARRDRRPQSVDLDPASGGHAVARGPEARRAGSRAGHGPAGADHRRDDRQSVRARHPRAVRVLRGFADRGGLVIYISHHLEEVFRLCDRVTVMKDGRVVRTLAPGGDERGRTSILMVGRSIKATMFRDDDVARTEGEAVLEVEGLTVHGRFADVSFRLHRGEVLGIGGLIGCGSEALALALFGDVRPTSGTSTRR